MADAYPYDWEEESKYVLKDADIQYDAGMELQHHAEESLLLDIESLIMQHNTCNKVFNNRVASYKSQKDSLELKCSQVISQFSTLI